MLRDLFQTVLECAAGYSAKGGALMERREGALKAARAEIETWLDADVVGTPFEDVRLSVQSGGRQADYGPVPWIRVYSRSHSPRTTEGFYLVWLFGAMGRRAYLSLNQGTSEWRGNKMRPMSNPSSLRMEAMTARGRLESVGAFHAIRRVEEIDLEVSGTKVGNEARNRVRNYERANIAAIPYESMDMPSDDELRMDVRSMLPLLAELYSVEAEMVPVNARARYGGGQGRLGKAAQNAVERRAVDCAAAYYESLGWKVEDVGSFRSYDLCCTRNGEELHVECKGTMGLGNEIQLTRGEVAHCRTYDKCSLVVVSRIVLEQADVTRPKASGGIMKIVEPWSIVDEFLTPTQYVYRVQGEVASEEPHGRDRV